MNLLSPLPDARAAEQVTTLLTRAGLRVERIVSLGHASPESTRLYTRVSDRVVVAEYQRALGLDVSP